MNNNIESRDKLLFGRFRPNRYKFNNTCSFHEIPLKVIKQLLAEDFIEPETPCGYLQFQDIYEFIHKYPEYMIHGQATLEDGLIVEGVEKSIPTSSVDEFQDFMALFRDCKHFDTTTMYCSFE